MGARGPFVGASASAVNAGAPLAITTYVAGHDEITHPDVVDAGVDGWNGYRYWLAATPYDGTDTSIENPSIWCSTDGDAWVVPTGATNPVIATPASGYNSDTDLVLDGDTLHLFWRTYGNGGAGAEEQIKHASSTDGVNWGAATAVVENDETVRRPLSPAVVKCSDGTWRMWAIDILPDALRHKTLMWTASAAEGPWTGPTECDMVSPTGSKQLWHLDVAERDGRYWALVNVTDRDTSGGGQLYVASSDDAVTWEMFERPTLVGTGGWDQSIYRACWASTAVAGEWDCWYGAFGADWLIGRTSISVAL